MMTQELPVRFARMTAASAQAQLAMIEDALTEPEADHDRLNEIAGYLRARLALSRGESTAPPADHTEIGRRAGSEASNQFGTFAVHAASEKQIAFLRKLIDTKDLGSVKVPADLTGISKKSASALIDKLVDRPAKAAQPGAHIANQASDKQQAFLGRLAAERNWAGVVDGVDIDTDQTAWVATLTSRTASKVIETLLAAPRRKAEGTAREVDLAAGAYKVDGRVIRVYLGQQSRKMLAAELVDAAALTRDEAWSYLGMASRFVPADAHRMTPDECEAVNAGHSDHGWCCVCGRELDDPNSVARGIGPVCRGKQGGAR